MRVIFSLLVGLAALPAAAGNIYKWTDRSGTVHYTQIPPPEGANSLKAQRDVQPGVLLTAPAAAPAALAAAGSPSATPKPTETLAAPAETKEAKSRRCGVAKERITFLQERTAHRLLVTQPDGSEARMTEEQYTERVAKANEAGKGC